MLVRNSISLYGFCLTGSYSFVDAPARTHSRTEARVHRSTRTHAVSNKSYISGDGPTVVGGEVALADRQIAVDGGRHLSLIARRVVVSRRPPSGRVLPGQDPHILRPVHAQVERLPENSSDE